MCKALGSSTRAARETQVCVTKRFKIRISLCSGNFKSQAFVSAVTPLRPGLRSSAVMRSHTEQHTLHSLHQRAQAQDGSSARDFGVGEYKSGCYLATVGFGHDLGKPKLFTCSESASKCAKPAPEVSPRLKGQCGGSGAGGTRNQQHPKGHPKVQHLPLLPGGHHGRPLHAGGAAQPRTPNLTQVFPAPWTARGSPN